MSKAVAISRTAKPRAKGKGAAKGFLPDRLVGGLALALDAVLLVLVLISAKTVRLATPIPAQDRVIGAVVLAFGTVAHVGVFRGARWGFALAGALAAWGLFDGGIAKGLPVVLSTNLWMLAYAAFRLGSAYGPRAR